MFWITNQLSNDATRKMELKTINRHETYQYVEGFGCFDYLAFSLMIVFYCCLVAFMSFRYGIALLRAYPKSN
jgi:hypothetical protein